jgi:sugar phosphate isomerase/epimerase
MEEYRSGDEAAAGAVDHDWGSITWLSGEVLRAVGEPPADLDLLSRSMTVGRVTINAGMGNPRHFHTSCNEILYLLRGEIEHAVGDRTVHLTQGDTLVIPAYRIHGAVNRGSEAADMMVIYDSPRRDFHPAAVMERLVASPVVLPEMTAEELIPFMAGLGFRNMEVFTEYTAAAVDRHAGAPYYRRLAQPFEMSFRSIHLPTTDPSRRESLAEAEADLDFAAELGVGIAIVKAGGRRETADAAGSLLDAAEERGITLVVQNHAGSPVEGIEDLRRVLEDVGDERIKVLMDVGHLLRVGESLPAFVDAFGDRIAYCHLADIRNGAGCRYGEGEARMPTLIARMQQMGYDGGYVLELETADVAGNPRVAEEALAQAIAHLTPALRGEELV